MKEIQSSKIKQLMKLAKRSVKNSYAPYSKIAVGCAVIGRSSKIYTGSNVENMSYGLTICAERVAISKAISEGEKKISAVVVYTDLKKTFTPCGACREFIKEFALSNNIPIICFSKSNKIKRSTLKELLPEQFDLS